MEKSSKLEEFHKELTSLIDKHKLFINYAVIDDEYIGGGIWGAGSPSDIEASVRFVMEQSASAMADKVKRDFMDYLLNKEDGENATSH